MIDNSIFLVDAITKSLLCYAVPLMAIHCSMSRTGRSLSKEL